MSEKEFIAECMPVCRKVYAHAVKIVGTDDANDVMQECLRRLWERKKELSAVNSIEAYAMRIGRNLIIDILHARERYGGEVTADNDSRQYVPPIDGDMESREGASIVMRLLGQLPEKQRVVIEMSAVKEMDNMEIAAATGMTDLNIRQILSRGRKKLKEMYIKKTQGWIS